MEDWMGALLMALFISLSEWTPSRAVNPGCECLLFTDTFGKEYGTFSSPDFPRPYPVGVECLLYSFLAPSNEIVEISFYDFNVQKIHFDCARGDFVKLFINLEHAEVNEFTPWSKLLCGRMVEVPPRIYSTGRYLVMEFHSDLRPSNSTGFAGRFRFLDKGLFQTDGRKVVGSECNYDFIREHHSPRQGRFLSPGFPAAYPTNKCAYRFLGRRRERVRVIFEEVFLEQGYMSCLNREDIIWVRDGLAPTSPVLAMLCGAAGETRELLSTGPDLLVEFVAKSSRPGVGFKASFQFQAQVQPSSTVIAPDGSRRSSATAVTATLPAVNASTASIAAVSFAHSATPALQPRARVQLCPRAAVCDRVVSSKLAKRGVVTSPGFPGPYPARSWCRFDFQGQGKERVRLVFSDFALNLPQTVTQLECDSVDALLVLSPVEGRVERVDALCGAALPRPLLSSGARLVLELRAFSSGTGGRGFRATYSFVENLGVPSGLQLPDFPCAFAFNASIGLRGTFASPNFPGLYPRGTECHYFFHGLPHQRVRLIFHHFDVEGVEPCEVLSVSDYVEFSDHMARDRKYFRHCGQIKDLQVESEWMFFRVTFRSNDHLDATGFNASYEFLHGDASSPFSPTSPQVTPAVPIAATTSVYNTGRLRGISICFVAALVTYRRRSVLY